MSAGTKQKRRVAMTLDFAHGDYVKCWHTTPRGRRTYFGEVASIDIRVPNGGRAPFVVYGVALESGHRVHMGKARMELIRSAVPSTEARDEAQ